MTGAHLQASRVAPAGRRHWLLFGGLAAAVFVVDQLVKAWIVSSFEVGIPVDLAGPYLRITISHNTGALFGLFRDQAILFALFSLGVIGFIVWYHGRNPRSLAQSVALGLLLGGALGNLIDRIRLGYVVDFVDMGIGSWRFYTYNVADSAITAALLLLIVLAFWSGRRAGPGGG
ncbi:MAG: signal peptidase II [Chloroflexota bacterium]